MKNFLVILVILCVLYWYFNIRGKTRCITVVPECNDIECVRPNRI